MAVLALGAGAAYAVYRDLNANITNAGDLSGLLGDRPEPTASSSASAPADGRSGSPVNVLVLGSDDRSGANAAIGGANDGMHSDTTIVAHISADRSRIELVSIPRDLLVDRPTCTTKTGTTIPAKHDDQFNNAFAVGWDRSQDLATAAACTWRTVESLTGVQLDGFLLLDFVGFQAMVDAIGGVPICLTRNYDDPKTGLHVTAGQQVFDGQTALQFSRARYNIGDGSDTQRILRQHDLMAAMARKVLSSSVLSNPGSLLGFARAATKSLTASDGFASLQDLTGLGLSLRHVRADHIVFVSMPTVPSRTHSGRVEGVPGDAALWSRISADQPIGEADGDGSDQPQSDGPAPAPTATVPATTAAPSVPAYTPPGGLLTSGDASSTCS